MKDVYYPDNEDVLEWANGPDRAWPESDWDFHVIDGPNDRLILSLISDSHKKTNFFLHCLYVLGGIILDPKQENVAKFDRLDKLLNLVTENSVPELIEWKRRVGEVRSGSKTYVAAEWFDSNVDY